jgi:hypothetical protein
MSMIKEQAGSGAEAQSCSSPDCGCLAIFTSCFAAVVSRAVPSVNYAPVKPEALSHLDMATLQDAQPPAASVQQAG